jgi:PST family polysaccharide transporter
MSDLTPAPEQPDETTTVAREELESATLKGVRWVTLSRIGVEGLTFLSSILLARLISPNAFGRVAVTLFVLEVATAISSNGFGAALVQRREISRDLVRAELALALLVGVFLTCVVLAVAVTVVGGAYGHATAVLFEVVAPVFLFVLPGSIAAALLSRRMDFRALGVIAVVGQGVGLAVTLILAAFGVSALAVIVGQAVTAVLGAVLQMTAVRLPRPAWRPKLIRETAKFGLPAGVSGITFAVQRNIDYAIVGAGLGSLQAGLYWRAFNVASEYPGKVTLVMQQMALPVYSRTEHLPDMRAIRMRIVRLHATVLYPCLALLAALAPVLVPWLYGARWDGAILPIQLLSVSTVIGILSIGIGPLLLAAGMARTVMLWNFASLAVYVTMLLLAVQHGIVAVCLWTILTTALQVAGSLYFLVHRRLGISLRELAMDAVPAVVASGLAFAAALAVKAALLNANAASLPTLLLATAAGATAYLLGLTIVSRDAAKDLKLIARNLVMVRRTAPS